MQPKDQALAQFLERFYFDIRAIEEQYGMQAGSRDLRLPVDYYHDAVRAWMAGEERERLSVDWVAHDLTALRKRVNWLLSGPQVFWQDKDKHYKQTLEKAREFKRWCIRSARELEVPPTIVREDLLAFAGWVKGPGELLERELALREAQKYRAKHWEPLSAEEFWQGFVYTIGFFKEMVRLLTGSQVTLAIEDAKAAKNAKVVSKAEQRRAGEEALKGLWLQMLHPLALKAAFKETKKGWAFDAERHVPEEQWEQMKIDCIRLSDAYEGYTLMFAAALAPEVDQSYKEQKAMLDVVVADSHALLKLIERLERGEEKLQAFQLERLVREADNEEMKQRLAEVLRKQRVDRVGSSGTLKNALNGVMAEAEQELGELEKAHFQFLSSQLKTYEESKTIVKQLASQGLNLAGKFAAAAVAVATGRGKGLGR